jgi:hypothetical protein
MMYLVLLGLLLNMVENMEGRLLCNLTNITDTSVYSLYQVDKITLNRQTVCKLKRERQFCAVLP